MRESNKTYIYHKDELLFKFPYYMKDFHFHINYEFEYLGKKYKIVRLTFDENLIIEIEGSEELFKKNYVINGMTVEKLEHHLNCLGYDLVKRL